MQNTRQNFPLSLKKRVYALAWGESINIATALLATSCRPILWPFWSAYNISAFYVWNIALFCRAWNINGGRNTCPQAAALRRRRWAVAFPLPPQPLQLLSNFSKGLRKRSQFSLLRTKVWTKITSTWNCDILASKSFEFAHEGSWPVSLSLQPFLCALRAKKKRVLLEKKNISSLACLTFFRTAEGQRFHHPRLTLVNWATEMMMIDLFYYLR